jgi:hypothetical protein
LRKTASTHPSTPSQAVEAEEAAEKTAEKTAEEAAEEMIIRLEAETGNTIIMKRKNKDYYLQLLNPLRRQSLI